MKFLEDGTLSRPVGLTLPLPVGFGWKNANAFSFNTGFNGYFKSLNYRLARLGPITRSQKRKLNIHEDNGMVAYMEEALKSKLEGFEDQKKASKLFSMCSTSKDQSREQIGRESD
ncbi:hypothetical protein M9H77_12877 [Catharanthus roseus]|uniref:Uncharacterized protein n=1 Tax=Catharanthus roseus TaxID=4058 RepID=A0ACC0BIS0_CATRO|nr:hypothetical protein M9H77_12877 [Catharanthus roseus]